MVSQAKRRVYFAIAKWLHVTDKRAMGRTSPQSMIEKFKQPKHFSIPAPPSKAKYVLFRQPIAKFQASGMPLLFEV